MRETEKKCADRQRRLSADQNPNGDDGGGILKDCMQWGTTEVEVIWFAHPWQAQNRKKASNKLQ
jgi:hypothetical protein